jgi:hypothetical protein
MKSYNDAPSILFDVQLRAFLLVTLGFKKLNACTKSGNNMC